MAGEFFFFFFFYWSILDQQVLVSGIDQSDSDMNIHVSILQILLPFKLLQSTE